MPRIVLDKAERERFEQGLRVLCAEFHIDDGVVEDGAQVMLGELLALPYKAPALWRERGEEDAKLTPIEFKRKYWAKFIDSGVVDQAVLRALDPSLYEAIKIYCRNRHVSAEEHLPRAKVSCAQHFARLAKAATHVAPRTM